MHVPGGFAAFHNGRSLGPCAACVLLIAAASFGQTVGDTSGAVDGVVTDRTGGVLPGVTTRATGSALMGARTILSGADGAYRLPALPPGEYTLTFSLVNFHPETREVRVAFGATSSVLVTLDVKALQEEVTVESGVRLLDQHSTTIAARVDAEALAPVAGAQHRRRTDRSWRRERPRVAARRGEPPRQLSRPPDAFEALLQARDRDGIV